MDWVNIAALLGGGAGVFLLKLYGDWHKYKRGDKTDAVGMWQQIADREAGRHERLENRIAELERIVMDRNYYIRQLERTIAEAGLKAPDDDYDGRGSAA